MISVILSNSLVSRSSRSQMFFKISVLKNFENFTGNHICWSLFLIKLQSSKHLRWLLLCVNITETNFQRIIFPKRITQAQFLFCSFYNAVKYVLEIFI